MSSTTSEQQPILAELAAAGIVATSIAELRHSKTRYVDAVPILLRWLQRVSDPKLKGELVRALSVPWAKPMATQPLIREFKQIPASVDPTGTGLRWTVGNSLHVLADDSNFAEIVELVRDRSYGRSRQMLVLALGRSMRAEAPSVLLSLMNDPDVDGHAVKALGMLRVPEARPALRDKLEDKRSWVRSEARKALSKLPI